MSATVIRHASRRRFTAVDRRAVNRPDLSYRALGVLVWLLDKPDGWDGFTSEAMAHGAGREGRDAVRSALRELETAGYIVREKVQSEGGKWATVTWIYEHPGDHDPTPSPEPDSQASVSQSRNGSTEAWKTDSRFSRRSPLLTERETTKNRALEPRPRTDERREGQAPEMYHPDDAERDRVRADLAAMRDAMGMRRSPAEQEND